MTWAAFLQCVFVWGQRRCLIVDEFRAAAVEPTVPGATNTVLQPLLGRKLACGTVGTNMCVQTEV